MALLKVSFMCHVPVTSACDCIWGSCVYGGVAHVRSSQVLSVQASMYVAESGANPEAESTIQDARYSLKSIDTLQMGHI